MQSEWQVFIRTGVSSCFFSVYMQEQLAEQKSLE